MFGDVVYRQRIVDILKSKKSNIEFALSDAQINYHPHDEKRYLNGRLEEIDYFLFLLNADED